MAIICYPYLTGPEFSDSSSSQVETVAGDSQVDEDKDQEMVEEEEVTTKRDECEGTTTTGSGSNVAIRKSDRAKRNVWTAEELISSGDSAPGGCITMPQDDEAYERRMLNKFKHVKNCVKM